MKIRLLLFWIFLCSNGFVSAQPAVTGRIAEQATGEPMAFVNVLLYKTDSTLVTGVLTDTAGIFSITPVARDSYYLEISFIGFETQRTAAFLVDSSGLNMGTIAILPSAQILGGVDIVDEKPLIGIDVDKKVYNVEKDLQSVSGSATNVLENIPSVTVNEDGTISLRGSSNVTIFINGRPSPMMRTNSAAALQQIPANTIERIEIITNPSAKYNPNGTAGIINIVLKKDTKQGLNGTATVNAGWNDRYNGTVILNYRPGKWNFYGSYGYRQDLRQRYASDTRIIRDSLEQPSGYYNSYGTKFYRPQSHTATFGTDYAINSHNDIGVSGEFFFMNFEEQETFSVLLGDSSGNTTQDYNRDHFDREMETDQEGTFYFEHRFKKEEHGLSIELALANHFEEERNQFTQYYRTPLLSTAYDNTWIRQWEKAGEAVFEYAYPVNEDASLEAGFTSEWLTQDFDFLQEYFDTTTQTWRINPGRSNKFIFGQQLHAGWFTWEQSIEDFGFLAGIRLEETRISSNLVGQDSIVHNNYFSFYPSLHLLWEPADNYEVQLSYSKRINRPEGDELNPFPEYDDPRNIWAGNPFLKPEQVHSFELGFSYRKKSLLFVPSVYYRYIYDAFTEVSYYIDDSTLYSTVANLSKDQSGGVEMILIYRYKKLGAVNFSGNLFYNRIDASNLGYPESRSAVSGSVKLGINANLSKTTAMQVNANYRFPMLTPQGKYLASYGVNLGLRQNVMKGKGSVIVTVSDVFNTMQWTSVIDTPELYQYTTGKRKSQIIYLGFSYRFGKTGKSEEDMKFDEAK
jgi:outer membrane receptor protein involved in Fe transport